jgi:hypothetical protein
VIDGLEQAPAAFVGLLNGKAFGKRVVTVRVKTTTLRTERNTMNRIVYIVGFVVIVLSSWAFSACAERRTAATRPRRMDLGMNA